MRFRVSFESGNGHWMVLTGDPDWRRQQLIAHEWNMIKGQAVPGLLRLELEETDGHLRLRYALSGYRMLAHALRAVRWTMRDALAGLFRLAGILADGRLYMLEPVRFVLRDDMMFVGKDLSDIALAYLPVADPDAERGEARFVSELESLVVRWLVQAEDLDGAVFRNLMLLLREPDFTPERMRDAIRSWLYAARTNAAPVAAAAGPAFKAGDMDVPAEGRADWRKRGLLEGASGFVNGHVSPGLVRHGAEPDSGGMSDSGGMPAGGAWSAAPDREPSPFGFPDPAQRIQTDQRSMETDQRLMETDQRLMQTDHRLPLPPANRTDSRMQASFRESGLMQAAPMPSEPRRPAHGLPPAFSVQPVQPEREDEALLTGVLSETEHNAAETTRKRRVIAACGVALMCALAWRFLPAVRPGTPGLMLAGGITLLLAAALVYIWLGRSVGPDGGRTRRRAGEGTAPGYSLPEDNNSADSAWRQHRFLHGEAMATGEPPDVLHTAFLGDGGEEQTALLEAEGQTDALADEQTDAFTDTSTDASAKAYAAHAGRAPRVPVLEWSGGAGEEAGTIALRHSPFVIGRSAEVAHHVDRSAGVSRLHVEMTATADGWIARDLGSRNGTLLNGRPMTPYAPYPLQDGDTLQIAASVYRFKT